MVVAAPPDAVAAHDGVLHTRRQPRRRIPRSRGLEEMALAALHLGHGEGAQEEVQAAEQRAARQRRLHDAGLLVHEGGARVLAREALKGKVLHGAGVRGAGAQAEVALQREVGEVRHVTALAERRIVHGDDAGEGRPGGSVVGGGGVEQRSELVHEARAGVVVQGELAVQALLGLGAARHGHGADGHEQEVDLLLLLFDLAACLVDLAQQRDVLLDEVDAGACVDGAQLVGDACGFDGVASDEVDVRGDGVAREFAGSVEGDAARAADEYADEVGPEGFEGCIVRADVAEGDHCSCFVYAILACLQGEDEDGWVDGSE